MMALESKSKWGALFSISTLFELMGSQKWVEQLKKIGFRYNDLIAISGESKLFNIAEQHNERFKINILEQNLRKIIQSLPKSAAAVRTSCFSSNNFLQKSKSTRDKLTHQSSDKDKDSRITVGYLCAEPDNHACPYIRLRSPLSDLAERGLINLKTIYEVIDGDTRINFGLASKLDILIIQRHFPSILPFTQLINLLSVERPKIVFEIDDAFEQIPITHVSYGHCRAISHLIEEYIKNADLVTVSTERLKSYLSKYNQNILVLSNFLDTKLWENNWRLRKKADPIKVLFSGTNTHERDLQIIEDAIENVICEFGDKIEIMLWGNSNKKLKKYQQVKELHRFTSDYAEYARLLKNSEIDFAIIPLEEHPFNQAKSEIKWLEYSVCKIPGIYSNLDAYNRVIKSGKTGILVNNTVEEWYQAIRKFIIEPKYIEMIRRNAYEAVNLNHSVSKNSYRWLDAYKNTISPVSIIIPVYNKIEFTKKCLEGINKFPPKGAYEIIIIDNCSTDGTGEFLKSIKTPLVKIITNDKNLGFAKACNQGSKAAVFKYLLFLNNDTEATSNWIGPLIKILDNDSRVAAVGSKLLFSDGNIQHAGVLIFDDRKLPDPLVARHVFYNLDSGTPEANELRTYQALTAACLLIRKEAFDQVGGFDEGYWNGYEDIDLCFKLQEKQWTLVYQPKSGLIHHESKSGPERFTKTRENIGRLHRKWIGKIKPDAIINRNGTLTWTQAKMVRNYPGGHCTFGMQSSDLLSRPCKMVSIIILTSNQLRYTKECVRSIKQHTMEPHEIIFVDNGSTDNTLKWLKKLVIQNPNYLLIENSTNLGFSKGCNQGIQASSGEYIVLLNNDVVVTENWLGGMLECLKHGPDIGIVGPMTNNISGPQKVPSVTYSAIHELDEYSREFRSRNRHRRIPNRRIVGFCMLFRRQLVEEIGFLDENFGSGNFEDDDLCLRAVLAGYRNMIAGDVFIHHYGSQTFIGNGIDYGSSLNGNRKIFIDKWSGEEVTQQYGGKLMVENAVVKADEFFDKGDIEKATACMLGALKQLPHERKLYYQLTEMLIDIKRYQDAVDILSALNQNDQDPIQLALLAYCEEALGHDETAREHAERALAVNSRAALPMNVLGVLAFKKGEPEVAEEWFTKAIAADPGLGESYTNLGSMKWAAGKTDEALKLFERGFIFSPKINDVASAYHTAVAETKSFENAEAVVREARALHPNHKRIAFLLIALLLQQEKHASAMHEIERAMIQFGIDDGILSAGLEIRKRIGALEIGKSKRGRATLSLCMIVKDEEPHLAKCLMSVKPVVDEMIVVDTGSSDRSKSIAAALGAKVFDHPWANDFSEARNHSLSKASGDWILVLDADEVVSAMDHGLLRKITKKRPAKRVAYTMVTRNYTNNPGAGGWVANEGRYAEEEAGKGWVSSTKVRLFVNDRRIQFVNPVHELVEPALSKLGTQIKECDVPVHHYGRLDQDKLAAKGKEYYRLGLAKIEQNRGDHNALREFAIQASEIGEYEEAVKVWQKVIELQPNDAVANMNLGFAFLMLRQYDKAIKFSKTAMEIDPELREAALNYAGAEMFSGDVLIAASTLEQLLERHPDYPPAMGRLAAAYILSGRKEEGLRFIEKLISKGFDGARVLEEQARAFMAESKFEAAVCILTSAVEKGIDNGSMNDLLAVCRSKIDGSAPICNPADYSSYLQRQPSELHGNSAAL
jgi:GT2 family glycosyltransferase/Flp pilus assembly protein TadD/glycosyltransferase involved in cell wall biosynthesis